MKATTPILALALAALATTSAHAITLYATSGTDIATFDSATPGTVASVTITGLQSGETLVGLDTRPFNQVLYGVGSSSRLYTINPLTGVATQVGTAGAFTLSGSNFAVDFNPVPDRLRVISSTGQNLRTNPNDGTLTGTDTSISGGTVAEGAYSNNGVGASVTTLYAIDASAGVLTTVGSVNGSPNSPNGGVVGPTVGSLGLGTGLDSRVGFDISGVNNVSVFASIFTGTTDKLYSINLNTGAATLVGTIGTGSTVYRGLTSAAAVPEPCASIMLLGAAAGVLIRRRRR